MSVRWFLGEPPRIKLSGLDGLYMHLGQNILRTVVFVGYADSSSPTGFRCEGTAFLVHYETEGYLVTARHIADVLRDDPFQIRCNMHGKAEMLTADNVRWTRHPDKLVDLAAMPARLTSAHGFEADYLNGLEVALTPKQIGDESIDVGDFAYTVGLFHFVHGRHKNMPMVYTGHISLMPPEGERIPIGNEKGETEWVEAYLIETSAINGASGSPVFVRGALTWQGLETSRGTRNALLPETKIFLLGMLQGAWFLPPDDPLRKSVHAKAGDVVPVGLGIVVPAHKITELLEVDELKKERAAKAPLVLARKLKASGAPESAAPASDENPNHREDFNSLLNAAARKPPRED
jgi:hypothetical protein